MKTDLDKKIDATLKRIDAKLDAIIATLKPMAVRHG